MTVALRTSRDIKGLPDYDFWVAIDDPPLGLDPARERRGTSAALEDRFDECAKIWFALARTLARERTGSWAHTPACAANLSDFGLVLAWTELIRTWAGEGQTTLVVCDDPWLFRHVMTLPGVSARHAPGHRRRELALHLRGAASRLRRAWVLFTSALSLRHQRKAPRRDGPFLLVYGHPSSQPDGRDGYFGDLMLHIPSLQRALHIDCPPARARMLAKDGRTVSLHAWGNPLKAWSLVFTRWKPGRQETGGPYQWLLRRAWIKEASTAQAMAIRWQDLCQTAWLRDVCPSVVAWPWENHAWERCLVRAARAQGMTTIGYQHSVVGRQMMNEAPTSNPDGLDSIPDYIFCNGPATRDRLADWGIPADRLVIAGALRFPASRAPERDPKAPVFLALPFDRKVAAEMVAAAKKAAGESREFLVKDHPMTPFHFEDGDGVRKTDTPLQELAGVSAVVYAATTVGLEAVIAGLPTIRFRPRSSIAIDVMPRGVEVPAADASTLGAVLDSTGKPPEIQHNDSFAPVNLDVWRQYLDVA